MFPQNLRKVQRRRCPGVSLSSQLVPPFPYKLCPYVRELCPTYHQAIVKQSVNVKIVQAADFFPQHYASHDSSARTSQTPAERYWVLNMDMSLDGELALFVTSKDVEGDAGDEVVLRIEADIIRALALPLVRDPTVQRVLRAALGAVDGDV